ncbi:hypothetical protein [Chryseobacterium herbae]|uniref:Lipoprotein n=1 Tax=Chryseobacterium herbae TaxID=2976476 RepID=A0ABT2IQ80_9FLAO|nr:hypothetical protein [Chryseobacterium sp. pc1-10]MCT2560973.1 hypothetical protein [Chryseobacterium sp. pc1-10]
MKKITVVIMLLLICIGCGANLKFVVKRTIVEVYENDEVKILVADNKDIIEAFKEQNNGKKCKEIMLGKTSRFKVIPVSDLALHRNNFEYILNDSTVLKYNRYFSIADLQNYCVKNK